jgi:molecular chaperone DnaK (HSP70)
LLTVLMMTSFGNFGFGEGSAVVRANLIGLDFGSSFLKATLVRPGKKFAIVENTASKRKTEAMVTLGIENRLFGADSLMDSGKYPLSTFAEVFRTFG